MLTITIETTNEAFGESPQDRAYELARILRRQSLRLLEGREPPEKDDPWTINDINGNKVGQCATVDERPTWEAVVGSEEAADALHMPNATVDGEPSAELLTALKVARKALTHDVPESCWATGPLTGNMVEDLFVCPGCHALGSIDDAITKHEKKGA